MSRSSVISIIKGGLGNQFFAYAAGRALALRLGRDFYVDHLRGYTNDSYGRIFRLNHFPIEAKEIPEAWRVAATLKHPRHKILRALSKRLPLNWRPYLTQAWESSGEELLSVQPKCKRLTINGYWSDERLFSGAADFVRRELSPPEPVGLSNLDLGVKLREEETSVFVHVRRVRYQTLLPEAYYERAIALLFEKVGQPKFYLFGDDIEWAANHLDFKGAPCMPIVHNRDDEIADLWLMTRCRHAIIANSSFSWWAAWLGGTPGVARHVAAPFNKNWMLEPAEGWEAVPFDM